MEEVRTGGEGEGTDTLHSTSGLVRDPYVYYSRTKRWRYSRMTELYYDSKYTGAQVDEAIGLVLAGKAILITNCPNCGAPVSGGVCEYCGTKFKESA